MVIKYSITVYTNENGQRINTYYTHTKKEALALAQEILNDSKAYIEIAHIIAKIKE
jgi:hypothetical protein